MWDCNHTALHMTIESGALDIGRLLLDQTRIRTCGTTNIRPQRSAGRTFSAAPILRNSSLKEAE
jgi:hypothetical protein